MKSRTETQPAEGRLGRPRVEDYGEDGSDHGPEAVDAPIEFDESSDVDESELGNNTDDDDWDVFILDDDCDPLPDYGDFWLPD